MKFLKNLFKKSIVIQDEYFGNMLYCEVNPKFGCSYFECQRHFSPSQNQIEIGIDANMDGPTQIQKEFFKEIESNYSNLSNSIKPLIEEQFRNWKSDFEITNFKDEFYPVYLRIPSCNQQPIIWEIAFESPHDLNHSFSVTMKNFTGMELLIDG